MNIAFVSTGSPEFDDYPNPSHGTSVQIWKLAKEYRRRDHEVTIYRATFDDAHMWTTEEGITIVSVPRPSIDSFLNGLFTKIIFSKRVSDLLQRASPDAVFLRERITALFPARLPVPTIYTVISPDACDFFYKYSVNRHPANIILFRYKQWIEEHVVEHADATIGMNEAMNEYFRAKGFDSIHTVSIAIEPDKFPVVPYETRRDRILFVGRMDYNKRPDWLLDAFASLATDWELHFVGSGPVEGQIRKNVRAHDLEDQVMHHGWLPRPEVLDLMASSKIVVLPSRFDNSPNVVLEAMAAGCSVLASGTRGARSMISPDETGLLFDPTRCSDLSEQLRRLLSDKNLRSILGQNARDYALQEHRTERIADRYLEVYKSAITVRE